MIKKKKKKSLNDLQSLKYERLMLVLLYKTILCWLCREKNIA